jgi:hypothetical protein
MGTVRTRGCAHHGCITTGHHQRRVLAAALPSPPLLNRGQGVTAAVWLLEPPSSPFSTDHNYRRMNCRMNSQSCCGVDFSPLAINCGQIQRHRQRRKNRTTSRGARIDSTLRLCACNPMIGGCPGPNLNYRLSHPRDIVLPPGPLNFPDAIALSRA